MSWGTNEKGTNEMGDQWDGGPVSGSQSNNSSKTLEWQVFSQGCWGLDLPILYLRITFPMYSWCATRNPVPDSTYHLVDLKSVTTESWNVSPCMTATPWSRVNWKMCDENSTFGCFGAICTQFSVTWPHCGTVHDFFWQFWLTALAVINWIFHSKMAVTARAAARACSSKQLSHMPLCISMISGVCVQGMWNAQVKGQVTETHRLKVNSHYDSTLFISMYDITMVQP